MDIIQAIKEWRLINFFEIGKEISDVKLNS